MANDTKLLKKITIKEVLELGREMTTEQVKAHFTNLANEQPGREIAALSGDVTGFGTKTTQFGESIYFTGVFFAQNRETGALYKAAKIYLPRDAAENLVASFGGRQQADDSIRFTMIVRLTPDPSQGYTYVCEGIKTPQSINREAELLSMFKNLDVLEPPKAQAKLAGAKK